MTDDIRTHLAALKLRNRIKSQASYRAALRAAVRALWSGVWDEAEFFSAFDQAIRREFKAAWLEGMKEAGLSAEDMTPAEQVALAGMIAEELGYIIPFMDRIIEGSKENGGKLEPHLSDVELWVKRYLNLKNQALQMAQTDPTLEWTTHANESCTSCKKLNGQRRRASSWRRLGVRPQHPDLECMHSAGGPDVCQCELHVTKQPPTRGRLPKWKYI